MSARCCIWLVCCVLLCGIAPEVVGQYLNLDVAQLVTQRTVAGLSAQGDRVVDLRLDDAIERALARNLDIAVERLNPQIQDLSVAQARAVFLPNLSSTFDLGRSLSPSRSQLDGAGRLTQEPVDTEAGNADVAVEQRVKWYGGRYSVGWDNGLTETNNVFFSFNPSYTSNVALSYTQPLLRGFRIDTERRQLRVSQISRSISDIDLRATIVNTLTAVRRAYWDLVYAAGSVDVQRQALDLSEQLVRDNRARVEIGTMAPLDVLQSQSEAAARRQSVAEAEQGRRAAELTLKQLVVASTEDDLWAAEINAVDRPRIDHPPIDIGAAVRTALDGRTDISRARRQQEINDVTVRHLRNDTLPSLDLVGTFRLQGQGGTQLISPVLGGPAVVEIPGGYRDAIDDIVDANFPVWNVQLQLTYPLGQSAQRAAHAQAGLEVQQTRAQIRQLELQIATEVTNAAVQIESVQERTEAARAARELAEQQLVAEQSKFEVGLSTNFFVVQAQRDLAAARDTELRAVLDYQNAVIEFERVQRTSLSRAGISIVGGGG